MPIDQFEELFSSDGEAEAKAFLELIGELGRPQDASVMAREGDAGRPQVLILITIRSDAVPQLQAPDALRGLAPVLFSLPPMPAAEFKSVIEGPARRHTEAGKAPVVITPALTEALIAEASGPDALPLLALTLEWLYLEFKTKDGVHLGLDQYQSLGGVRGVIDKAVARALNPADATGERDMLERVFLQIATVDPVTRQSKRRLALRAEMRRDLPPEADALVTRLIEKRLLVADSRKIGTSSDLVEVVELAHEALLRQWDALERWLRSTLSDLVAAEAIKHNADEWRNHDEQQALLVHADHRLMAAEALLVDARLKDTFRTLDADYVKACRERETSRTRERAEKLSAVADKEAARLKLRRVVVGALGSVATVVVASLGYEAYSARNAWRMNSLALAGASEAAADAKQFDRGIRLAILAVREKWLRPAHATALPALLRAADGNALMVELAHKSQLNLASFSPDGRRVVTASDDNTARIWNAETGEALGEPLKHDGEVLTAVFSADGTRVVTASKDRTAKVWDAETGDPVGEPLVHQDTVNSAVFSGDGKRVVTACSDRSAHIWNLEAGEVIGIPLEHAQEVYSAVFNADGSRVVTASADMTARVWDAVSGYQIGQPMAHRGAVVSAVFSADGKLVVTASKDKRAKIWNAETGKAVR